MKIKLKNKTFQKLCTDFWSVLSVFYILLCAFVAVFAYVLAPDNSQNANTMHLSIHSKPPMFSVKMLTLPTAETSFSFINYFVGTEEMKTEIPINQYNIDENGIYYTLYPLDNESEKLFIPFSTFPEKNTQEIVKKYISEKTFWLGTDKYGRDMLSRMLIGTRISFTIGFVAVFISLFIGTLLGLLAGYYSGKVDAFILWLINVTWSIPTLLLVIAFTLALGKGYWQVFVAVGLTMWVEVARIVRGQTLSVKNMQYVEAAKVLGFSDFRIIFRHILPNIISPLLVIAASNFASAILIESGLSFLGIGAQPPVPSWGGMIKDHYYYIAFGKAYLAIVPGVAIMLLVLSFMLIANKLRDIFSS
ncbi:MAG: ABC transporter permease [Capnocytophaga sp.]|nr:ABC transporter permease [Capnocytophaga sp.]